MESKTKANIAFVFSGFIEDINDILQLAEERNWNLIFVKKSLRKLRISEEIGEGTAP